MQQHSVVRVTQLRRSRVRRFYISHEQHFVNNDNSYVADDLVLCSEGK